MNTWLSILLLVLWIGPDYPILPSFLSFGGNGREASYDGQWLTPVANGIISSNEADHLRRGSVYAWDISVPHGTSIYPMAAGNVVYAGCNNAGGYGCWVLITHGNGYSSLYAHMIDEGGGTVRVQAGDVVTTRTILGRVGWTGMTSFGPHVHWEIHNVATVRDRIDEHFSPASLTYCRFCSAPGSGGGAGSGGLGDVVQQETSSWTTRLVQPGSILLIVLILLLLLFILSPGGAAVVASGAGGVAVNIAWFMVGSVSGLRESRVWIVINLFFTVIVPFVVGFSLLAVQIWMIDEGMSYRQVLSYFQLGFFPDLGIGYLNGAKYSAVWGAPCQSVGTLGRACTEQEIVEAALRWKQDVDRFAGVHSIPVAIPRITAQFDFADAKRLIYAMHQVDGLVVADVAGDQVLARDAIDELTAFGLDGIALDLEFMNHVSERDLLDLAFYFAHQRRSVGQTKEGVMVVWDVFHNLERSNRQPLVLPTKGVTMIPIFTGYGATANKASGLYTMQSLFGMQTHEVGMMAFDQRWPINSSCLLFDNKRGYDCQRWERLFSHPTIGETGWWVQQ